MSKAGKKLTFYVDTECVFSNENKCSYYMSKQVQKQAGNSAQLVWGHKCCPIVYLKTAQEKFAAFCPTQGGPWGEHLPILSGPGPKAVKIEIIPRSDESWAEIIEKAAKMACEARS